MNFSHIYKQFFTTATFQVIGIAFTLLSGLMMARLMEPEAYGSYSYAMSILMIMMIPISAGISQLLVREIAQYELQNQWGHVKGICKWANYYILISSFIIILLVLGLIKLNVFESPLSNVLLPGLLLLLIRPLLIKATAILNGFRLPSYAQFVTSIVPPLLMLLSLLLLYSNSIQLNEEVAIMLQIFSVGISCLIANYLIKRKQPKAIASIKPLFSVKSWHKSLWPFTIMVVLTTLNNEICLLFIGFLNTKEDVAYFKVATQAVNLVAIGLMAINMVIGPNLARIYKTGDLTSAQNLLTKSVRLSCIVALPVVLMLIFFSGYFVSFIFGVSYLPAKNAIVFLCIGQAINVISGSVGLILNMTGNEKEALKFLLFSLIINIILLLLLVPMYSFLGAAIASSISMTVWNLLMARAVLRKTKLISWLI